MFAEFGTNNQATRKKRVYYTEATTIAEGMPVCYDFDTTTNSLGWDKGNSVIGSTTAEGNQNEGKYIFVEDPEVDNLDWFAGVIASGTHVGQAGPRWVDIYIPNGAIVPVETVLTATVVGRTILSINSGTNTFGNPTTDMPNFETTSNDPTAGSIDARPVAVAMETISSAGLVLAKLCPDLFVHQGGQSDYEMQVAAGTVDCTLNRRVVQFLNTSGHCQMLHYRARLTGDGTNVGDGEKGVFRFETFIEADTATTMVFGLESHLEIGSTLTGGLQYAPLRLTVRTKNVDPNLSAVGKLSAIQIEWHMRKDTTSVLTNPFAANASSIFYINADSAASTPGNFIITEHFVDIGAYVSTSNAPVLQTGDVMIPIIMQNQQFYLVAFQDDGVT